jgi:hypothetical protein
MFEEAGEFSLIEAWTSSITDRLARVLATEYGTLDDAGENRPENFAWRTSLLPMVPSHKGPAILCLIREHPQCLQSKLFFQGKE